MRIYARRENKNIELRQTAYCYQDEDEFVISDYKEKVFARFIISLYEKHMDEFITKVKHVLEVGCGTGYF